MLISHFPPQRKSEWERLCKLHTHSVSAKVQKWIVGKILVDLFIPSEQQNTWNRSNQYKNILPLRKWTFYPLSFFCHLEVDFSLSVCETDKSKIFKYLNETRKCRLVSCYSFHLTYGVYFPCLKLVDRLYPYKGPHLENRRYLSSFAFLLMNTWGSIIFWESAERRQTLNIA